MPADRPPLRQIADRLVHHRLKNRQSNIRLGDPVVDQRLNIRLGKNAAAGSDRINLLPLLRQRVKSRRVRGKKRRHMVDKRARSPGAVPVHALLRRLPEIRDLRVLAAQLYRRIRLRNEGFHRRRAGDDLLHKRQPHPLCYAHPR